MTSKVQQYELLPDPVEHDHESSDNAAPSAQNRSNIAGPSDHVRSNHGFPAQVFEAVRTRKTTALWVLASHVIVTGILIATIVLGATKRTYALNEQAQFLGITFSVDNQMFFFGLFNKVADYVLNDSIGRISGVLLTVWMSGTTRSPGVLPIDFELSEEMAKPWRAVLNGAHRWKRDTSKNTSMSIVRILASFASGCTVLLLGGSFNVVAMPKLRWTGKSAADGDTSVGSRFETSATRIDNVNWSHLDSAYNKIAASASLQSPLADFIAAVASLDMLTNLVDAINMGSLINGNFGQSESPAFVNLYTIQRASATQFATDFKEPTLAVRGRGQTNANLSTEAVLNTISIQEGSLYDFWTDGNHSIYATQALGARNWFNFTIPVCSTMCVDSNTSIQDVSITILQPTSSTFTVNIPASDNTNGKMCAISLQQALFPIYVYNSTQDARDEMNTQLDISESYMKTLYLPHDAANAAVASSLASKLNTTIPYLEQATGLTFTNLVAGLSVSLATNANSTYVGSSSTVAMNYVIGSLAQHLLTIATWEESDSGQRHLVGPIQFQLYGSGPRQDWQWAIAMVLGLAVIVLAYDMFLMTYERITPGPWLSVPGMMIAANSASSFENSEDVKDVGSAKIGEITDEIERTKYCLAAGEDGLVEVSRLGTRRRSAYR